MIQGGWSLGSGVKGDGVIQAIVIGGQPYFFVKSADAADGDEVPERRQRLRDRAKGHNVFREIGGVRVTTDPSDCNDVNPAGGVYRANKAAGYFPAPLALSAAGEPAMDYVHHSGSKPSVQLVTDFDNDGTADGILVGETVYGHDWWVPGSAAAFVKTGAPSTVGGSARTTTAPCPSGARRSRTPRSSRRLVAGLRCRRRRCHQRHHGRPDEVHLLRSQPGPGRPQPGGDHPGRHQRPGDADRDRPDGDTLTFTSTDGTVAGNKLTYAAPADAAGPKVLAYKVTDSKGASTNGTVTVTVTKASSTTKLKVSPGKITTKSKHIRGKVDVTSTGALTGGTVDLYDGTTKIGTGVLDAAGHVKIAVTAKLSKGKHTIKAVFAGTGSTATSQASVIVKVKNKK